MREAGPLTVNPLKDQTFMAGWLALRYLKNPELAEPHFQAMSKAADGPSAGPRPRYWLGRTAEAKGDKAGRGRILPRGASATRTPSTRCSRARSSSRAAQSITTSPPARPTPDQIRSASSISMR